MPSFEHTVEIEAYAQKNSGKALLCWLETTGEIHWIPQSLIHDDSEVYDTGHSGKLVILHWFAEKEGLL